VKLKAEPSKVLVTILLKKIKNIFLFNFCDKLKKKREERKRKKEKKRREKKKKRDYDYQKEY
tara:strand:- start:1741 stop:1926 length:186 start_codon:yes stop_codon:yes gene_type:complete